MTKTGEKRRKRYNFTNNFYMSTVPEHFAGHLKREMHTHSGSYQAFSSITELDKELRPWILIRYTFRKNVKRKIPLNNFIKSREKGISLTKEQE
ncbi:MAG TPA: hypothetical protein H9950_09435 [Candidatus Bacteroides avicola]|uniref:Uncharacterized protein n=1 Tax=Candidatus Bacteroides avicola TaxID=2838468 RepID=A0A9D2HXN9_9BACE|nr:hypothetical protein [Candidatus Bacteroides avicola]